MVRGRTREFHFFSLEKKGLGWDVIPTAMIKSHFPEAPGHKAELQASPVHGKFWGAGAMHTGLIPLIPVLSRDAPEMEPGCLSRISP